MDIFPVRMEVDWEELGSGKIVIVVKKDLSSVEEKVANFLGAPKTVRRPLDEMNSKLWLLMDGKMSVDQKKIALEKDKRNLDCSKFTDLLSAEENLKNINQQELDRRLN